MSGIFKAYDIRGRYPNEINESMAEKIGAAFVILTGSKDVMVGRDARNHSKSLADAFINGALSQGASVTDVGLITTSQMISMRSWNNHDTAVMVTASHLDAPFNGFKMLTGTGQYISENYKMKELQEIAEKFVFDAQQKEKALKAQEEGKLSSASYTEDYAKKIVTIAGFDNRKSDIKFVADCSDGCIGPELLYYKNNILPNLVIINDVPNGNFSSHSPNPIAPGALEQASNKVKEIGALGGCVFDADADRLVFIDEKGELIHPNYIGALLAQKLLQKNPSSSVAYDLISSRIVPETILASGGTAIRTKVGRANVIDLMMKNDSVFGTESSSHMMFKETFYGEAAALCLLLIINILDEESSTGKTKKLSDVVEPFKKYALQPETNFHIENPKQAMEKLAQSFPDAKVDRLDGVSLIWNDGWIVARPSNTEPLLRLRGEADTQEILTLRLQKAIQVLESLGGKQEVGH